MREALKGMGRLSLSGVEVRVADDARGRRCVYWASDWGRLDELVSAGHLVREFTPGHGDPYAQSVRYMLSVEEFTALTVQP